MSQYSQEEIAGPIPALGSFQPAWVWLRRGSGQKRHTVITLELWAAPYSLPVGLGYLYRKSLPNLHPTQLQSCFLTLPSLNLAKFSLMYRAVLVSVFYLCRFCPFS